MTRSTVSGREKIQVESGGNVYTGFYEVGGVITVWAGLGNRSGHIHGTECREIHRAARLLLHELVDAGEVEANTHPRDDDAIA